MPIEVHEVDLQTLVNSGSKHAKSVLGLVGSTPSESHLLGSGGDGVAEASKGFLGQASTFVSHAGCWDR